MLTLTTNNNYSSLRNLVKTEYYMKKIIPGILAMTLIVVASNILVQYILFDGWLTWGALTYPLAFLTTDVMNKIYGPSAARKVILAGFITGIVCSLIGTQIINDFGPLVTLRIAIASGLGFLTAQIIDLAIFEKLILFPRVGCPPTES